ncbi:MAG TPA: hypothetical protein VID94_06535, partial [Acidimicrobiales bacterium]
TILALTLALSGGGATALAANPPTTTDPGAAAAGWIALQVDAGVGPGSLADAIFAYASTGVGASAAATALARLETAVDSYILDGSSALVPGNLAKTLLAVQVAGGDPTTFGGHDLETQLRGLMVTTPGPNLGRFGAGLTSDQAYAVVALSRTSGGVPADALAYFVSLQCSNGDFQWDGSCPGAGAEDPDTTGLAVQALIAGGASAAEAKSVQLLLDIQGSDGAFSSFGTPNTNSSGVAGQALRAAGKTTAANKAEAFIKTLQFGCSAPAAERGAYPWAASSAGFLIFSTPQAILAFGGPALGVLSISGASNAAPVLACATAPPPTGGTGAGSGRPPTAPPTDGTVSMSTPTHPSAALLLIVLLAAAGGGRLAIRRLRR